MVLGGGGAALPAWPQAESTEITTSAPRTSLSRSRTNPTLPMAPTDFIALLNGLLGWPFLPTGVDGQGREAGA
jgi:hypothetical protein